MSLDGTESVKQTLSAHSRTTGGGGDDDDPEQENESDSGDFHEIPISATGEHIDVLLENMERFRQQILLSRSKHSLASHHMASRQYIFFILPMAFLNMAIGIMAFLASTSNFGESTGCASTGIKDTLAITVGAISFLLVFMQTLSTHRKYGANGEVHALTGVYLRELKEDFDTLMCKTYVTISRLEKHAGNMSNHGVRHQVSRIEEAFNRHKKRYASCLKGCRSDVPERINHAFRLLDSQIEITMSERNRDVLEKMYGRDYNNTIYFEACGRLATMFSSSWKWPIFIPDPSRAVDRTMDDLRDIVRKGQSYWEDCSNNVDDPSDREKSSMIFGRARSLPRDGMSSRRRGSTGGWCCC